VVGGLLVWLPLLWTQEVWDHGSTLDPLRILLVLALAFVIVVAFNAVSGFRRDRSWSALLLDAVEGMGLSIVVAAAALFVAAGGALYFALNVAPTEEVRTIAAEADLPLLLLAVAGSLTIGVATELTLGRRREGRAGRRVGPLDGPLAETVTAYAVALIVSFLLLWSFGLTDGLGLRALAGTVVMLSVVATFGAEAGRLLVGGETDEAGA